MYICNVIGELLLTFHAEVWAS